MKNFRQRMLFPTMAWVVGLLVGILFGLVVLGWWLWPVQWANSYPALLSYPEKVSYLRTIIAAYGFDHDQPLATMRYESLGDGNSAALSEIAANPQGLQPELIASFSQNVANIPPAQLETNPTPPPAEPGVPVFLFALFALVLLVFGGFVSWIIFRKKPEPVMEAAVVPASPILAEAPAPPTELDWLPDEELETATAPGPIPEAEADVTERGGLPAAAIGAATLAGAAALGGKEGSEEEEPEPASESAAAEAGEPASEWVEAGAETTAGETGGIGGAAIGAAALVGAAALGGKEGSEEEEPEPASEPAATEAGEPASEWVEAGEETTAGETGGIGGAAIGAAALAGAAALGAKEGGEEEVAPEPASEPAVSEAGEPASEWVATGAETTAGEAGGMGAGATGAAALAGAAALGAEERSDTEAETPTAPEEVTQTAEEEAPPPPVPWEVKMAQKPIVVEGIGPVYAQKLEDVGITTTGILYEYGATRRGRKAIAEKADIPEALILRWLNHIDLFRIKGIGPQYAELLEASGVDTVLELAQRNPENLMVKLAEVNEQKRLVRKLPVLSQVTEWVNSAQGLPRHIEY